MPSISIDYAVMEKAENIINVPVDCGWNDLGSWDAIYDINSKDKDGNVKIGTIQAENCKNSFFSAQTGLLRVLVWKMLSLLKHQMPF